MTKPPIERPDEGGSYTRDAKDKKPKRVEFTKPAEPTPADAPEPAAEEKR